jgi:mono/diheme cytochrome c family protein
MSRWGLNMETSRKIALVVGIILVAVGVIMGGRYLIESRAKPRGSIVMPELSSEAKNGEIAFTTYCVSCHGKNAGGTDKGPSLVEQIYSPAHHSDFSFVRAITLGVPQHHWLFGGMPPQPQVGKREIDQIVVYLRELQRANGIS